ncbi:MAG TPA: glycosyltransferase family 2 protein [Solirubrobacteraceae bacterium]|nr:glycosyltransferase family 2 protein [Solirubrobacteraceae bacterium]
MTAVQTVATDTGSRATLSACIIARDESASLEGCLASVAFCDEIVLVDSGSTDRTTAIARAAGARVVEQPWLGFAAQRNVALDHATGTWVLEIDADERVTPELRREIERFLAASPNGAQGRVDLAGLPLREIFLGHPLGPAAKYPKYRHRLLRRGAYRHDEARTVHEGFIPEGAVQPLEGDLTHLLASTWSEAVADAWRYARLEAGQLQGRCTLVAWLTGALLRPAAKLLYRLMIDGGWRDGWPGLARISLDCATDTVVWTRHLLGRRGAELGASGVAGGAHYGSRRVRRGPLRALGVIADTSSAAEAECWLASAQAAGADVALIGPHTCVAGEPVDAHDGGVEPAGTHPGQAGEPVDAHDGGVEPAGTHPGQAVEPVDAHDGGVEPAGTHPGQAAEPIYSPLPGPVRVRQLARSGPLALIRALDAEDQLRPADAVVPFGWRARLLMRGVPGGLRGELSQITQETDPATVNWRVRESSAVDHR